ncbi:hypothetical protein NMY22_g18483 [Coprinellus aureogranulatus]|nr:hypothetical protein NMY22_g18483 [Coprinellus aureogranulatus]
MAHKGIEFFVILEDRNRDPFYCSRTRASKYALHLVYSPCFDNPTPVIEAFRAVNNLSLACMDLIPSSSYLSRVTLARLSDHTSRIQRLPNALSRTACRRGACTADQVGVQAAISADRRKPSSLPIAPSGPPALRCPNTVMTAFIFIIQATVVRSLYLEGCVFVSVLRGLPSRAGFRPGSTPVKDPGMFLLYAGPSQVYLGSIFVLPAIQSGNQIGISIADSQTFLSPSSWTVVTVPNALSKAYTAFKSTALPSEEDPLFPKSDSRDPDTPAKDTRRSAGERHSSVKKDEGFVEGVEPKQNRTHDVKKELELKAICGVPDVAKMEAVVQVEPKTADSLLPKFSGQDSRATNTHSHDGDGQISSKKDVLTAKDYR